MTYQFIEFEVDAETKAAIVTLNRPEVRNALRQSLMEETLDAVQKAQEDTAVRSILLTGKGDKAFAAGADIKELQRRNVWTELGATSAVRRELARLLEQGDKPSIAAINGDAIGGGLELAMACTIRVAVPTARLGLGEINLGIMPGNGGVHRLVRLVGLGRALEVALTGDLITGEEGYRIGLINRLAPLPDLMPTALAFAKKFAGKSPVGLRAIKESALMAFDVPLAHGLAYENKWWALMNVLPDKQEGVGAFLEKRRPNFGAPRKGLLEEEE